MRGKKKGFTLVELLVVIAILAVILLIAAPIILNVLEKSKKNTFKNQALLYVDGLKQNALLDSMSDNPNIVLPESGKSLSINVDDITMDSNTNVTGNIVVTNKGNGNYSYVLYITNGEYIICNKEYNKILNDDIKKGNTCGDSLLYPTISNKYQDQTYNYKYNITSDLILNGVEASDTRDGDITNKITYTGTVDTSIIGDYEIIYSVENSLGNISTTKRTVHVKDTESPKITNVIGNPSNWVTSATLTVEATDNYKLHAQAYSFDNGVTWQLGNTKQITTNGEVTIKVRDESGNISEVSTINIEKVDSTEPTVSLSSSFKKGTSYNLPTSYTVDNTLSGGSAVCKEGNTIVTNTSSLSEGIHTINCTVTTGAGKTATVSKTIQVCEYCIGDQVTLKDNSVWYVIENSYSSNDTVTLFASSNIKYTPTTTSGNSKYSDGEVTGWTTVQDEYKIVFDAQYARKTSNNSYCESDSFWGCHIYAAQEGIVTNGNISGTVTEDSTIKKFMDNKVKPYINNSLTSNGGTNMNSIRLITVDEICNIVNASNSTNNCSPSATGTLTSMYTNVPRWLYSTDYWTMTPRSSRYDQVYDVFTNASLRNDAAYTDSYNGARPVIVTNKSNIK